MKELLLILSLAFLISCQNNDINKEPEEKEESNTEIEIIGKTIEYKYGESIYHLTIDTDSTLHWMGMTGDEKGHGGNEQYIMDRLPNGEIFITWGEENGTGVSQVLDFKNSKVYNHLSWDREVATGSGKIRILE